MLSSVNAQGSSLVPVPVVINYYRVFFTSISLQVCGPPGHVWPPSLGCRLPLKIASRLEVRWIHLHGFHRFVIVLLTLYLARTVLCVWGMPLISLSLSVTNCEFEFDFWYSKTMTSVALNIFAITGSSKW
jgi:hypothetical protein